MQVHMLVALHETVQLAPKLLRDAPYTVYTTCVEQRRIAADPAAAICHAPLYTSSQSGCMSHKFRLRAAAPYCSGIASL